MATPSRRPDPVERLSLKIKTLLNNHLKEILRNEGLPVSGVKHELVNRLQAHLQILANQGDHQRIQRIQTIAERGQGATSSSPPSSSYSPNAHSSSPLHTSHNPYTMPRGPSSNSFGSYSSMGSKSGMIPQNLRFKPSPFFTIVEHLVPIKELRARENTRDNLEIDLTLSPAVASRLQNDPAVRVMIYCAGDTGLSPYTLSDVAFPHQVELKCNLDEVKANLRGLKNKPGSTRPADITNLVRKKPGYPNKITVTWALTTKRYFLVINLVKKQSVEDLVQNIKHGRVISKEQVLREMRNKADDTDIVATSSVMSLKCPLSTLRIDVPTRSTHCTHNQCFDATSFLQLQEQAPTWTCPICNKSTPYELLTMDLYVDDILKCTSRNIEQVTVEPNGDWSQNAVADSPNDSGTPDDGDDDSDLVEIQDSRLSNLKQEFTPASSLHRTPPYSSREQSIISSSAARHPSSITSKRPASTIIDLTESDDEIPVRPLKRPSLAPPGSSGSNTNTSSYRNDGISFQLPRPSPTTPSYSDSPSGGSGLSAAYPYYNASF